MEDSTTNSQVSSEKKTWLLGHNLGLYILSSCVGIMINHDKDPYEKTGTMKRPVFFVA